VAASRSRPLPETGNTGITLDEALPSPTSRRRLPPTERGPQILEAALEEFSARGFAGARMAEVARRAGIAKGLIYHYFPSKTALFEAVVRDCTRADFEAAERQLSQHTGPFSELLAGMLELGYRAVCQDARDRVMFRLIIAEAANVPELARFYRAEMLERSTGIARRLLAAGAASGEFRPEVNAPGFAEVVLAPVLMLAVWRIILGDAEAPDAGAMRAAHRDLLLAALLRPSS
jgi:AcrR family transcriptional regulator